MIGPFINLDISAICWCAMVRAPCGYSVSIVSLSCRTHLSRCLLERWPSYDYSTPSRAVQLSTTYPLLSISPALAPPHVVRRPSLQHAALGCRLSHHLSVRAASHRCTLCPLLQPSMPSSLNMLHVHLEAHLATDIAAPTHLHKRSR